MNLILVLFTSGYFPVAFHSESPFICSRRERLSFEEDGSVGKCH